MFCGFKSFEKYWGAFLRVLGERLNGIQEVSGSIPLISTKKNPRFYDLGFFFINIVLRYNFLYSAKKEQR